MRYFTYKILFSLFLISVGCSTSDQLSEEELRSLQLGPNDIVGIQESISLNINEVVYFDFVKIDTTWAGELTTYTLNEAGKKVVNNEYVSARDSSWNDFDAFVQFLNIYEIGPQNQIDGWVPNSAELPRRVYNFEVFDGDTTRSFSYQDPINDIRDYWQAQNLLTFVTFIQNDLHWIEKPE